MPRLITVTLRSTAQSLALAGRPRTIFKSCTAMVPWSRGLFTLIAFWLVASLLPRNVSVHIRGERVFEARH